jgi:hypothetical protein
MAWYSCYRNSPSERQPKSGCTSFLFARRQKNKGLTHVGLKCCSCMFKFFHENSYRVCWFIAIVILLPRRILSMLEIFSGGLACQTMKLKQLDWILVWRSLKKMCQIHRCPKWKMTHVDKSSLTRKNAFRKVYIDFKLSRQEFL